MLDTATQSAQFWSCSLPELKVTAIVSQEGTLQDDIDFFLAAGLENSSRKKHPRMCASMQAKITRLDRLINSIR